jgi:hypothetical protein
MKDSEKAQNTPPRHERDRKKRSINEGKNKALEVNNYIQVNL